MRLFIVMCGVLLGCGDTSGDMDGGARDLSAARDFSGSDDFGVADLAVARDLRLPLTCDLLPATTSDAGAPSTLWLAAPSTNGDLVTARFSDAAGWSAPVRAGGADAAETAIAIVGGQPLVALRQNSGNALKVTAWDPCNVAFGALADPFANAFAAHRPAVVGGGGALVFQGGLAADQRLYFAPFAGGAFASPTSQDSLLTTLSMTALAAGSDTHVFFAGTNKIVYDGTTSASPGGGAAIAAGGGTTVQPPAATRLADGTLLMVFTGEDTNLYWSAMAPAGSYTTPQQLCTGLGGCLDDSNGGPAVTATADGKALAAWVGKDRAIYTAIFSPAGTLSASRWSAAVQAGGGETTLLPITLAPGVGSALAELVYVREADAALRHTRWQAASWVGVTAPAAALANAAALAIAP